MIEAAKEAGVGWIVFTSLLHADTSSLSLAREHKGKLIPYYNLPEEEYARMLMNIGLPEIHADVIADWDICASNDDLFDDSKQLSKLIGRPTTSLSRAVEAVLKSK